MAHEYIFPKGVETELGGPGSGSFPQTSWAILHDCRNADGPRRKESLDRLIGLYWKPVYCMVRRAWAKSNEDAKDLTQEFFARIVLEGPLVERFSPERGSFRTFLKASVKNFLAQANRDGRAVKRGGAMKMVSLDEDGCDIGDLLVDGVEGTSEEVFDRAWQRLVLARSLRRLEDRLVSQGHELWWKVFQAYELEGAGKESSYQDLGRTFGVAPDTVKLYLSRARQEFLDVARGVLSDSVDNPEDLSGEIDSFLGR